MNDNNVPKLVSPRLDKYGVSAFIDIERENARQLYWLSQIQTATVTAENTTGYENREVTSYTISVPGLVDNKVIFPGHHDDEKQKSVSVLIAEFYPMKLALSLAQAESRTGYEVFRDVIAAMDAVEKQKAGDTEGMSISTTMASDFAPRPSK